MIPDDIVDRVRETADIVKIIGEYVPLKRLGTDFRGPCPFHQGTHRNFSVSPRKNMYYCFVCHEGGDVFAFLRKRLGLEWPAAVRLVAESVGIEIPESESQREGPDPRETTWELNTTAAEYFSRMLWEDDLGREARAYIEQRGITREVAEKFALGFAPREIGLLRAHMNTLGFGDARLLEAGLLTIRDEGAEPRPRFRGRLMFPIYDATGHCVGFGGRLLGAGEPKYLNSSDSAVFSKGRLLYGLNLTRNAIRKEGRAFLVEGYFDVVRLVASGIEPVVAPLGTSLTEHQAALLKRFTTTVYLLYDSDKAGLKATFRAGDILLSQGMSVQVVTLPEGEDPDTFVGKFGKDKLESLASEALDIFDRKVQLLERSGWFRDLGKRRRALDHLLPTIRATSDPLMRDLYATRASEASGVRKELLLREADGEGMNAGAPGGGSQETPDDGRFSSGPRAAGNGSSAVPARIGRPRNDRATAIPGEGAERMLLVSALQLRSRVDWLAERLGEEDFWNPAYRRIYGALLSLGDDSTIEDIERELEAGEVDIVQSLILESDSLTDAARMMDDSLNRISIRRCELRLAEIDRELPLASDAEKNQLMTEKVNLRKQVLEYGGVSRRYGKSQR